MLFLTQTSSGSGSIFVLLVLVVVFYLLLIRPEKKRKKAAEAMRNSLRIDDRITTIGGIKGKICHITDDNIVIETSEDLVRIEMAKWAVATNETANDEKRRQQAEKKKSSGRGKKKEAAEKEEKE